MTEPEDRPPGIESGQVTELALEGSPKDRNSAKVIEHTEAELRFQLNRAEARITRLEKDIRVAHSEADSARATGLDAGVRRVAEEVATPVAHLIVQLNLMFEDESTLTAEDLKDSARGLAEGFAKAGVHIDYHVGDSTTFDPAKHVAISGAVDHGTAVIIRSPGVSLESGEVLRKSTVELNP